ncbi:MAG: lipid-A-disaccharide synthase [Planctomycetota bacterium]
MRAVVLAAEPSGDLLASAVVRQWKLLDPALSVAGLGGPLLAAEGMEIWEDPTRGAETGLSSLGSLMTWVRRIRSVRERIESYRPDILVGVDSPDFTLRVFPGFKGRMKVVQLVAPSAWAWRPGRRELVGRLADLLLVVWPFEKSFFEGCGCRVEFPGQPLLDTLPTRLSTEAPPEIPAGRRAFALLPGSRPREVALNLPLFVQAARRLLAHHADLQFVIPRVPHLPESLFTPARQLGDRLTLVEGRSLACMKSAVAGFAVNGTVSVEAMLLGLPHLMAYAITPLQYCLYRPFVKIQRFNLVNRILGEDLVPELILGSLTVDNLEKKGLDLLGGGLGARQREAFARARTLLGETGAAGRAAARIMETARG